MQTRCTLKGGQQHNNNNQQQKQKQKDVARRRMKCNTNNGCSSNLTRRGSLLKMNMGRMNAKNEWWLKDASPNMIDINGTPELLEALCNNQDKLVVVDVYAKWCGACRALYPKLCKMGRQFDGKMVLLKVNFDENKDMCKTLGVKVLPYMIMYKGNKGRVEEFSVSISKIKMLREKLDIYTTDIPGEDYSKDECNLEEFATQFGETWTWRMTRRKTPKERKKLFFLRIRGKNERSSDCARVKALFTREEEDIA